MKKNYLKLLLAKSTLLALLLAGQTHAQDVYVVESLPYQVYTTSMPVQYTVDDMFSEVISIPFDFKFFGNDYSDFVISTNGHITFNTDMAGEPALWYFTDPIPDVEFTQKNAILGCYHDLYAANDADEQAAVTWSITGDAPYRQFVLTYSEQPQYSCLNEAESTFQIIMYESYNYIDVQVTKRQVCTEWNNGNAVIGVINDTGELGFAAPGRNTGPWEVTVPEGWRFRPGTTPLYRYIMCDDGLDGLETFDLTVIQGDLDPSAIFYETMEDAALAQNAITGTSYTNINPYNQTIYAAYNGQIREVLLSTIDCSLGYDNDTVASNLEDVNADGNLGNDDTDGDGLPDFLDNDDDGDQVLTFEEYVFIVGPPDGDDDGTLLDTDGDGIANYLDNDDDGDGVLTIDEDYNQNGDVTDDDANGNTIPDYLENEDAAGMPENQLYAGIKLYPNPSSDILNIGNDAGHEITDVSIYSINGVLVKRSATADSLNVSDLQNGMYIVKVQVNGQVLNYKFIKK